MQRYLIMVISSAVLAAVSHSLAPDKWSKYINAITGIMIVSVIASPVLELKKIDLFSEYTYETGFDENAQKVLVCDELEKRISDDAQKRIKENLNLEVEVKADLSLNEKFEITGVKEMTVWTKEKREQIQQILEEAYSPQKIFFR